jgi:hypothetical protein
MSQQLPPLPEMLPLSIDTNPSPPVSPLSPLSPVSSIHNNISSPSSSPVVDPNLRVQPVTNPVITPSSQLSNGHPGSNVTTSNLPNGNANPQPNLQQAHPVQAYGIHSPSLQQSSGAISSIIQNGTTGAQDPKVVRATSWWWWWEIGSSLLSMTSMCLILAILFAVNEKPLRHWKLAIQPNSLISVFTTVGKTAMMVSVTSCVSQLKWRHFQRRPQKLSHLQLFDDASRGPWGALLLLFGVRSRAFLAWIFAIITIIALAIEPSAQQILDFPTRVSLLSNVTADIGRADSYYSRAFVEGQRK